MLPHRRASFARWSAYRRDRSGPRINTIDELGDPLLLDRPVWVIADRNVGWAAGPNTRVFLARSYQAFHGDGIKTTYGHGDVPRC